MLKLTKTGIGLLTRQYRSVLKKCFLINLGILIAMHSTKVEAGIWFMNDVNGNMKVCGLDGNTSYENCISMGAYNTNYMYLYQDLYSRNEIDNILNNYYKKINQLAIARNDYGAGDLLIYDGAGNLAVDLLGRNDSGGLDIYANGVIRTRISSTSYAIYNSSGTEKTVLSDASFKLNGSSISATGIVASATQNSTALITSGGVYSALNNYYRKEDFGDGQVIDFTRYFKTGKFGENAQFLNNKSTTFDAERAENVPAAELRCKIVNETSKKFAEMPHNSPAGEGTLSAFHRKAESVMDNLSKCRAANDNFIKDATTFLRAI